MELKKQSNMLIFHLQFIRDISESGVHAQIRPNIYAQLLTSTFAPRRTRALDFTNAID